MLLKTAGIFFLLLLSFFYAKADDNVFDKIHNDILNIETNKAKTNLLSLSIHSPEVCHLHSYADFIEFLTTSKEISFEETINKFSKNIEHISRFHESAGKIAALCDLHLYKACIFYLNKNYVWSIAEYIKAKGEINTFINKYPKHFAVSKYELITIFADILLNENLPFANKTSIDKQRSLFIKIITQAESRNIPDNYKKELKIISSILFQYIENDYNKQFDLIKTFGNDWSKSGCVESIIFAQTAAKANNFSLSHKALLCAVDSGYNIKLNRINLSLGISYLNQFNDSTLFYLNYYINNQANKKDVSYAQLKLCWYYFINNNNKKTKEIVNAIIVTGKNETPEEQQAKYEIENYKNWNKTLLISRIAFDGGNYNKSIKLLLNCNTEKFNSSQMVEYNYRLARTYDMMNNNKAITYYNKVIESGMENTYYYPAYSAYYAGLLSKLDYNKAKLYFEKCLKFNSPIYEWSIHKKAKQELAELD